MGIKGKQFGVGVGPKIAGFRRFITDDIDDSSSYDGEERPGIDFNLRAIPLGGDTLNSRSITTLPFNSSGKSWVVPNKRFW